MSANLYAVVKRCCSAASLRLLLVCCWAFVGAVQLATAQNYSQIRPKYSDREARPMKRALQSLLTNATSLSDADETALKDYFEGYEFAAMTGVSPEDLTDLADRRVSLIRDINQTRSTAARNFLLQSTMSFMAKVAGKNTFHPAVRYNAVLVLSELDQTPGQTVVPASTRILLQIVKAPNESVAPSSIKVAALVGLQRHARLGIDQAIAQEVTDAMLAIISAEQLPKDVSTKVADWMKCQAAGVLAQLHSGGVSESISAAIVSLIGDENIGLDDRCYVSSMLVNSMFTSGGVDFEACQTALGNLAKDVMAAEQEKAVEYREAMLQERGVGLGGGRGGYGGRGGTDGGYGGRGGGRGGYGGRGGGFGPGGMGEDDGPHFELRRMLDRVMGVLAGLDAVAPASSDPVQSRLNQLTAPLRTLADAAVERDVIEINVANLVVKTAEAVNQIVDSWGTSEDPVASVVSGDAELLASE